MYYCPCPCSSDTVDPESEENTFLSLPRNLSYVQESYFDAHNVSGRFVYNPRTERRIANTNGYCHELNGSAGAYDGIGRTWRADGTEIEVTTGCISSDSCGIGVDTLEEELRKEKGRGEGGGGFGEKNIVLRGEEGESVSDRDVEGKKISRSETIAGKDSSPCGVSDFTLSSQQKQSPCQRNQLGVNNNNGVPSIPSSDGAHSLSSSSNFKIVHAVSSKSSSFISRVTSLISPKDEKTSLTTVQRDLGSSVDDESVFHIDETVLTHPLLKSPDRSLAMDRGDDLVTPTEDTTILVTDQVMEAYTDDTMMTEEVLVVEYGDNSASDPVVHDQPDMMTPNSESFPSTCPQELYLPKCKLIGNQVESVVTCGSPDSDAFSEEGVFVNMVEDTDVNDKAASVVSDDTSFSVDSMYCSPDEGEQEPDKTPEDTPKRMSLEEAISKAASDFNKMTMLMYPSEESSNREALEGASTSKDFMKNERLQSLSRGSPLRGFSNLSVEITDYSGQFDPDSEQSRSPKESPIYEDNEFNFNKKGLRKSSSLKTNKTPPGTPHRKKVVRFADAMGLDLESVRHVLNMESPPRIPASAMADLKQGLSDDRVELGARYLTSCFTQPGAADDFMQTVIRQKVCLENAIVTDMTITGFVRVANIAFHKNVRVRYTHNRWATFHDIAASYIQNSCDGPTDRFSFSIVAPAHFITGNRLEFALSFNAEGAEYWDNNGGNNYVFECFAKTVPTENDREWLHFL